MHSSTNKAQNQIECCGELLNGFTFQDLVEAHPPQSKGVYVIRIRKRTKTTPKTMFENAKQLVLGVGWNVVEKHIMSRVQRITRIESCPVVYIGSAGTQRGSRNTLKGRYEEFSGRHTAMYPIWVLLYFGWKLEFGWKECVNPSREEKQLKREYEKIHQGKIPALIER